MRTTKTATAAIAGVLLVGACSSTSGTENTSATTVPGTLTSTTSPGEPDPAPATDTADSATTAVSTDAPGSTSDTSTPDTSMPDTSTASEPSDSGDPVDIDAAVAALQLAADTAGGEPFDADLEDGGTWEISVAVDGKKIELRISADGSTVIDQRVDDDPDTDPDDGFVLSSAIDVSAIEALQIVAPLFSGRVDEMDLDLRETDVVWEIALRRDDDSSFDVVVDAMSGVVLDVDDDRRPDPTASSADLVDVAEYDTVVKAVPGVAELTATIQTDNPNSRVILFQDGSRPLYKSIYVKDQNRLKLIDLTSGDLIVDGPLA